MKDLKIIAYLFVIGGTLWVVDFFLEMLLLGRFEFNVGFIGIFVGRGLLRYERRWLTCAYWLTAMGLIFTAVVGLALLGKAVPSVSFQVFGIPLGQLPDWAGAAACAGCFAFSWWQYGILKRDDVRRLFTPDRVPA